MDILTQLIDFFVHIDEHLNEVIADYGVWTYLILFAIVFFETGIVVTPSLPGDSLLFAAGAFAASGSLEVSILLVLLVATAIIGTRSTTPSGRAWGRRSFKGTTCAS